MSFLGYREVFKVAQQLTAAISYFTEKNNLT